MNVRIVALLSLCAIFVANLLKAAEISSAFKEHLPHLKEGTVQVLVDGAPRGSGFVISDDGLIATCFHVVQTLGKPDANGFRSVEYAKSIEIKFNDGSRTQATISAGFSGPLMRECMAKDFAVLKIRKSGLKPLRLGKFVEADEGTTVCCGGYPLGIDQVIVATGIVSTKFKLPPYLGPGGQRDVAWLDITMNAGNSGGPVVMIGPSPKEDKVIGIATFNLNPHANNADKIVEWAEQARQSGGVAMLGFSLIDFFGFVADSIRSGTHGVGGCVSIDYLRISAGP